MLPCNTTPVLRTWSAMSRRDGSSGIVEAMDSTDSLCMLIRKNRVAKARSRHCGRGLWRRRGPAKHLDSPLVRIGDLIEFFSGLRSGLAYVIAKTLQSLKNCAESRGHNAWDRRYGSNRLLMPHASSCEPLQVFKALGQMITESA